MPCYKLGVRFGTMEIIKRFLSSGRSGIYFKVLKEGKVQQNDEIQIIKRDKNNVTVKDLVSIYNGNDRKYDIETIRRAIRVESLSEGWKNDLQKKLDSLSTDK
jgi:MOSC domain-containing protein YiiM